MHLQDFYDYKNQLMKDLLENEAIFKLIDENATLETAPKLAYKQVFPCEYLPDTVEEGKTYVCFDVDVQESLNSLFLLPILNVWVFTHRSKLRLPEGGVRTDKLCSEICKVINGSKQYCLGKLNLYAVKRFAPMTDYQGKMMAFHGMEVNHFFEPNKTAPANRKREI